MLNSLTRFLAKIGFFGEVFRLFLHSACIEVSPYLVQIVKFVNL